MKITLSNHGRALCCRFFYRCSTADESLKDANEICQIKLINRSPECSDVQLLEV